MCSAENNKGSYAKVSEKSLRQQIDVVAEFHAYKIHPQRIAYRTGIEMDLVTDLGIATFVVFC